jgi:hypothetical protein
MSTFRGNPSFAAAFLFFPLLRHFVPSFQALIKYLPAKQGLPDK